MVVSEKDYVDAILRERQLAVELIAQEKAASRSYTIMVSSLLVAIVALIVAFAELVYIVVWKH